jgi:hypothetical protein
MGFREAKRDFLEALKNGRVSHESRAGQDDKNWILSGQIDHEEAADIVNATRGNQAGSSPHHLSPDIEVWIFKPTYKGDRWYVKGYLKGSDFQLVELRLLSFHPSERDSS